MSRRRKALTAVTVVLVLAAFTWMSLPYAVRREVRRRAESRGLKAEVGDVKVRPGRIELRDVRVSSDRLPVKPFVIGKVTVLTSWLEAQEVEADGASLEIDGDAVDLVKKVQDMKGKREGGGSVRASVKNFRITWAGPCSGSGSASAEGVSASSGTLTADSVSISCHGVSTIAQNVSAGKGQANAKSVEAKYGGYVLRASGVTAGPDEKDLWSKPWARADSATLEAHGATLEAKTVRASADAIERSAKAGAGTAVLKYEGLQGDVLAENVEVGASGKKEGELELSVSTKSLSGVYKAVTGDGVTAMSLSGGGTISWGKNYSKPWGARGWRFALGSATAYAKAEVREDGFSAEAALGDPGGSGAACNDLLTSIPKGMVPKLDGFAAEGRVQAGVKVDMKKEAVVQVTLKNGCKFVSWPDSMSPKSLKRKFSRTVYGVRGEPVELDSGPGTKDWVPYLRMSRFLTAAVQTTEDPGFFRHKGVDVGAVENSIKQDIESGKFVRGASTVTMQLAKNLWLTRSKTISRKVQEAFLTTYLEQVLTKEEILELYFNIVEFGPMLYGVGPASRKYFGSPPDELSLGQSLFLTSVLPSPKAQWFGPDGKIQESRMKWLHAIMETMRKRNLVSEGELQDGLAEWLVLGKSDPDIRVPEAGPVIVNPGGLDPDWGH